MTITDDVKANRDQLKAKLAELNDRIATATATEARKMRPQFDAGLAELQMFNERLDELHEQDAREAAASRALRGGYAHVLDPAVYTDPALNPRAPSFFKDLRNARLGDWDAADRLRRNEAQRGFETRAGDMTTVAGAGGQFAPPAWLVEEFVRLARPGRVTADLMDRQPLPGGVSSISLPKVAGGSTAAVQITQNSSLSDTAMTTTSVSSGITTIAGKQIVSVQLLDQSPIPFDRVILGDIAADYAKVLDAQVLAGTGANGQLRGLKNGAGVGGTTWTTAAPKVTTATNADSFYSTVIRAGNAISVARYLPPTAVVMHPTRWAWVLEAIDTATRPLIVPTAQGPFGNLGTIGEIVAEGSVGTFAGLPVYTDPNIETNLGAGTNQDLVYVVRAPDCTLWESDLRLESFDSTYADQASVLFRALGYAAFIPDRWGPSVNVISGTGLVAPTL